MIKLDTENYKNFVSSTESVVYITTSWCSPCRMLAPIVEEVATEFEGKVQIGKLDAEEAKEITDELGIRNVPTILYMKNGQVFDKSIGAVQKSVLVEKINNLLNDF
jgi:thioredoxin 1